MKHYTRLCIVLDASGSMEFIKPDTQGSFNSFLKRQQQLPERTVFDLYQFNSEVTHLIRGAELASADSDLMAEYTCIGTTAMNNAICVAIDQLGLELAELPEAERPDRVVVVILTDGEENASKHFTKEDVKVRIKRQQDTYHWEFIFLAANQDAFQSGSAMGLDSDCCMAFCATPEGMAEVGDMLFSALQTPSQKYGDEIATGDTL